MYICSSIDIEHFLLINMAHYIINIYIYECVCVCVCVFTQPLRTSWMQHMANFKQSLTGIISVFLSPWLFVIPKFK